jgi:hypothetical protein
MLQRIAKRIASINLVRPNSSLTPTENNVMNKLNSILAATLLIAASANAQTIITIDRDYNGGSNIAEYSARDNTNPFDGIANFGSGNFASGTSVGPSSSGTELRRNAFFFEIPTGYTTAQINEATFRIRLNSKSNPTTDLSMYWAALDTLGTRDGTYAISTFSSASFTDTGLGLATTAATATTYTFDITSLVRQALDLSLSTTVVAFRFQMDDDISLAYGTQNNYTLLGFDTATVANRPALTLDVVPEPSTLGLLGAAAVVLLLVRRRS